MKTQTIEINTGSIGLLKKVSVIQEDSNRQLKCILSDFAIPSESTARIYAVKPSGAKIYNDGVIEGANTVLIDMTTQLIAEIGEVACQVEITESNGNVLTSFDFIIEVNERLKDGTAIESTNEFTALENVLSNYTQVMARINSLINDDVISAGNAYSSSKVEQLLALMNYKKAVEKEKVIKSSGYYALYQISNIVIMIFNKYFTGGTSGYITIDYTENIDVPSYRSTQSISGGSVVIEQGSRTIKLPTNVELNGTVIFIVDSASEEGGDAIADIIADLGDLTALVNKINSIPVNYNQKNILNNVSTNIVNNGITYTVNEDKSISVSGTATADSVFMINSGIIVSNDTEVLISGCSGGSLTTHFLQIGNSNFTTLNVKNLNGDNSATLRSGTTYIARIVVKKGIAVNNLIFKPMIRLKTENNSEYVPYVEDLNTRLIAIENNQKFISNNINITNEIES